MTDWAEILRTEGPAVWRTSFRLLGNRTDADDCFQETFVAALELSRREPVRTWRGLLLRLATVRAMDRVRQRCRGVQTVPLGLQDEPVGSGPSPLRSAEEGELAEQLRHALGQIPATQAEVFCLHALEGWSYREIADHLRMSVVSVGVTLHRARQHLRRWLVTQDEPIAAPGNPTTHVEEGTR